VCLCQIKPCLLYVPPLLPPCFPNLPLFLPPPLPDILYSSFEIFFYATSSFSMVRICTNLSNNCEFLVFCNFCQSLGKNTRKKSLSLLDCRLCHKLQSVKLHTNLTSNSSKWEEVSAYLCGVVCSVCLSIIIVFKFLFDFILDRFLPVVFP
jgi:hypothetical protein